MEINQVPLTTASSNQFGHTVNFGSNASNNSSNERYHRITVILINKVKLCRRQISKNQFIRVQHYSSGCISCSVNLQFFIAIHTSEILIWSLINVLSFSSSYTGLKSNNFKYLHHQRFCKGKNFRKIVARNSISLIWGKNQMVPWVKNLTYCAQLWYRRNISKCKLFSHNNRPCYGFNKVEWISKVGTCDILTSDRYGITQIVELTFYDTTL